MSSRIDSQTDNLIFNKVETYLDHLLWFKIYVIPNFLKVVRAVLDIYESCVHGQINRQTTQTFRGPDLSRSSSRAQNICNTKFCENPQRT